MEQQLVIYGLIGLGVLTLVWCIYHAGKADQQVKQANEEVTKAVKVEEANNELERQSRAAADAAIAAGARAGAAPDDPDSLPDEVRSRILGRKR